MLEDKAKELEEIYQNLSNCFYDILDKEDLSYYKGVLLIFKVHLLQIKQYEIGIAINEIDLDFNNKLKDAKIKEILMYILAIVSSFMFLPAGIIMFLSTLGVRRQLKTGESYMQNIFNNSRDLFEKCDTIALNCQTFINKKMMVGAEKFNEQINRQENIDLEPYYYAQNLIDLYINFDELMDTTPEIEEIVVKMLQSDLETSETDFMALLNMAKEKLGEEKIEEKKEQSSKLWQKYDESCRKLQKIYNKKRKSSGRR